VSPQTEGSKPTLRLADEDAEGSPYPKASLWLRLGARVVDLGMAYGIYVLGGRAGAVLAVLFLLFADGMLQGQSVGKKIFGVKVMHVPSRSAARSRESVLRNAPLALVVLLGVMPEPLGLRAFIGGAVVIGGLEAWKVWRHPLGIRWGDAWAQTQVVDGKVVIAAAVRDRVPAAATTQPTQFLVAARTRRTPRRRRIRCASL
jgi:hypothetical protein